MAASENLIRIAKSIPKSAITHNLLDNRRLDKIDGRCRASLKNAVHFCGHPICFFVNETIRPAAISGSEFIIVIYILLLLHPIFVIVNNKFFDAIARF